MGYYIILSIFFLFTVIILRVKYKDKFIFTLPLILFFLEAGKTLSGYYDSETGYNGFIFAALLLIIVLSIDINRFFSNVPKGMICLFGLIVIYFAARVNYQVDYIINIIVRLGNFVLILFIFFIGFIRHRDKSDIYFLCKNIIFSIGLAILVTIICSVFKIGESLYRAGIVYGPTQFQVYSFALFALLSPYLININKQYDNEYKVNRNIIILLLVFSFIIISLSLMRTAWVIMVLGLGTYFVFSRKDLSNVKLAAMFIIILGSVAGYIYVNEFYLFRESRFSPGYEVENEGRVEELRMVNELLQLNRTTSILGTGYLFDARYRYAFIGRYAIRPLHGTYTNIMFGSGYLGLFLFILFMLNILRLLLKGFISSSEKNLFLDQSKAIGIGLFWALLLSFFSGNTTYGYGVSYFTVAFLTLGVFAKIIALSESTSLSTAKNRRRMKG